MGGQKSRIIQIGDSDGIGVITRKLRREDMNRT